MTKEKDMSNTKDVSPEIIYTQVTLNILNRLHYVFAYMHTQNASLYIKSNNQIKISY